MPDEAHLNAGVSPARLYDPDVICARAFREFQRRRKAYLERCLAEGIEELIRTPSIRSLISQHSDSVAKMVKSMVS